MRFGQRNTDLSSVVSLSYSVLAETTTLSESDAALTIQLIDQRQTQLLEDLDILNSQIENIIQLYYQNRHTAGLMPDEGLAGKEMATRGQDAA